MVSNRKQNWGQGGKCSHFRGGWGLLSTGVKEQEGNSSGWEEVKLQSGPSDSLNWPSEVRRTFQNYPKNWSSPGWPGNLSPPASASQVLGLQDCVIVLSFHPHLDESPGKSVTGWGGSLTRPGLPLRTVCCWRLSHEVFIEGTQGPSPKCGHHPVSSPLEALISSTIYWFLG
jgi:hypothetical protein